MSVAAPLPMHPLPGGHGGRLVPIAKRHRRLGYWIGGIVLLLAALAAVGIHLAITHAEPILRRRVIETLSARFHSRIDLAGLHVSVLNGLQVWGEGLKIYGTMDPNPTEPGFQPLLEIQQFRFGTTIRSLLYVPMHVKTVYVQGMTLNVPPREQRAAMRSEETEREARSNREPNHNSPDDAKIDIRIIVDHFDCQDTKLIVNTLKPGHLPLEFDISSLDMKDVGPGYPLQFDATLVNPKPLGDIQSSGNFGPLDGENPRNSPVEGSYSFTHADLGTLKGIGGILSSTGKYSGELGRITVDGTTETPDFRLAIAGHPVPLHTDFHAIVDGTDGDTYLQPVKARLLQSSFTAEGKIVRVPHGHDIELDVVINKARIQDMLRLGVRTDPPIMNGPLTMRTKLSLPPGEPDVANRLQLAGTFHIPQAVFTNDKVQDRIDSLSLRSQGKAKLANEHSDINVPSDISGTFTLHQGLLTFSKLDFVVPGTHAAVDGQYGLDGNTFDFHGLLRLDAKVSQMTTGWKSVLLKPVDPFFAKHGAGTELPFKITGTKDEPHIGLDFGHKDEKKKDQMEKPQPESNQNKANDSAPPKENH
jgi:AsmA-like C-terminal region